jgi:putative membrane protein
MMGYGWGMGWGWVFGVLLLLGLVVLIVVAVRALGGGIGPRGSGRQPAPPGTGSARQVLDERYARGELRTEEYRERLRVLDEGR